MEEKVGLSRLDWDEDSPFPALETDRLILRRSERGDHDFLVSLHTDSEVMQFIYSGALTLEQARSFAVAEMKWAARQRQFHKWLLELEENCMSVGWVQVSKNRQARKRTDLSDDFYVWYELAPEQWVKVTLRRHAPQ